MNRRSILVLQTLL